MAKKKIDYYVFEPGISKDVNLLPNAVALLLANKAFLQQEVVRFINYNITNDIGPYVGYTYASAKCTRDVGFFIDAIAHDLRYGGNVKTRLTSDYFWINGEPQIRGDVSPEITGQRYLRDIINEYIFTNTTVPPVYGTPISPQIKITGSPAEVGADSRNTELWDIFGNVWLFYKRSRHKHISKLNGLGKNELKKRITATRYPFLHILLMRRCSTATF